MEKLIDFNSPYIGIVLDSLLKDRTTGENIIWATSAYKEMGYSETDHIESDSFLKLENPVNLQPRIEKSLKEQKSRTRSKAEVFTPVWICNQMNNYADADWFERDNVFNTENADHTWTVNEEKIEFPEGKTWQDYILSRRLEITCGEAPYLVSRYDASTGEIIQPPKRRIGLLDRKLRIVNENTETEDDWNKWVIKSYQSCYGYEYQGDSLLIARINLFMTFIDYYNDRWNSNPKDKALQEIAEIISWNVWQMDGFIDSVPLLKREKEAEDKQLDLFGEPEVNTTVEYENIPCIIKDWQTGKTLEYNELKDERRGEDK